MSKALFKVMSKSTGYIYNVYKVNDRFNLYKIYNYFEHEYQWLHVDNFIRINSNLETINKYLLYDIEASKEIIAELKKENEFLKLNNPEMNIEHFRIVKENKRKIDNLRKENKKLKNFITNLISTLNHCELNGTKKLDIVSNYIKQEYENILNGR